MKTIEQIIYKHYNEDTDEEGNEVLYFWNVKNAMIEYAKIVLDEAANKAKINIETNTFDMHGQDYYTIDKASILNIINELK